MFSSNQVSKFFQFNYILKTKQEFIPHLGSWEMKSIMTFNTRDSFIQSLTYNVHKKVPFTFGTTMLVYIYQLWEVKYVSR